MNIQGTNKGSDLTAHMHRLVLAFAGRTYHIVGNRMPWLKYKLEMKILNLKVPPIICSRRQFQILSLFSNDKHGMLFHETRLLADDSHEISFHIFVKN